MKISKSIIVSLLLVSSAFATSYTVKAGGGGNFTTIAACTAQMSSNGTGVSDTCTVFAGTYSENVSVPAGSTGNYKIVTVNGSDVVTITGITLAAHTKLIGNCTPGAAINTCGFSQTGGSISVGSDAYLRNNNFYTTGTINVTGSFNYIQGNTILYPGGTGAGQATDGILTNGSDHTLIENNDIAHYRLGVTLRSTFTIIRNNTFHDQFEVDSGQHTDAVFSEPVSPAVTQFVVVEGNYHTNANGPNAKGFLFQGDACAGNCFNAIIRFNRAYHIGGTYTTNDLTTWTFVKEYNNTWVDTRFNGYSGFFTDFYVNSNASDLNSIFYYPASVNNFNPYAAQSAGLTNFNYGHALFWCTGTCGTIFGHSYNSGSWLSDPGNQIADPLFVNYSSQNFHLQVGSPAIAAGTNLTTVNGTIASSTALVVNDASYFQDGYGLSTVSPDCIYFTTASNHVCITAVNYTTNTLTLASPISATNGDPVGLYSKSDGVQVLTGTEPDMGALPFTNPTPAPALVGVE